MTRKHSRASGQGSNGLSLQQEQANAQKAEVSPLSLRPLAHYIRKATIPAGLMLTASAALAGPQGGNIVGGLGAQGGKKIVVGRVAIPKLLEVLR